MDRRSEPAPTTDPGIVVLMPLFNDWVSASGVLRDLDRVLTDAGLDAQVLIVNDGSTIEGASRLVQQRYCAIRRVQVLNLRRNLGHQRAIAVALAYLEEQVPCEAVVVMDGDGEDQPSDVPRLLERYREENGKKMVFAERTRRAESLTFRMFYILYKAVHLALTGYRVRVGNFSVIPRANLASLVVVSEMWNHYAAAAFRSGQAWCSIPTVRGRRLDGKSKMNFVSLVTHGLSAMSVNSEVIGTRLLMVSFASVVIALAGVALALGVKFTTSLAIPGWATYTVGMLVILMAISVLMAFVFTFVILGSRSGSSFLPRRDYSYFVGEVCELYRA